MSSHGGLALVGRLFKRINRPAMIDPHYPVQAERGGIANSDIIMCYLGMLTLGRNDFERALGTAYAMSAAPLLLRADSGFCSRHLITQTLEQAARLGRQVDLLIKWKPRNAPVETLAAQRCADTNTAWTALRACKRECVWSEALSDIEVANTQAQGGHASRRRALRHVYRITARTIDKRGNAFLLPEYVLEGWTTTLSPETSCEAVIALHRDHATHE
ncbi:MAG: hypothetical protein RL297_123 [Pseudomonadota bacterium]